MSKKTPTPVREYKSVPQHIKAVEGRTVTGIFSVFGNVDSYGDIIHAGAFTKTIAERLKQVFHLWQHDFSAPAIAHIDNVREVGRDALPEDVRAAFPEATGGVEVTRTYLDTERGNEILKGLQAGVPYQMSFAFDAVKYDFEEDTQGRTYWGEIRNLREVRLYEVSDVLWGANDATRADSSKSPLDHSLTHLKTQLDSLRQGRKLSPAMIDTLAAFAADLSTLSAPAPATPAEPIASGPSLTDLRAKLGLLDL